MKLIRLFVRLIACTSIAFSLLSATSAWATNLAPLVNQPLVPSTAAPGSQGFTITLTGAGFVSTSVVYWNGTPLGTNFLGAGKLQAEVSANDLAVRGTAYVTVSNPAPGGGMSNVIPFTITVPSTSVAFNPLLHGDGVAAINLLVADFNGDNKPDLAVFGSSSPNCNATDGAIEILEGNGHGGFIKKSVICSYGNIPFAGVVGDFNHDGRLDLAVISANGELGCGDAGCAAITIYLGNGDGTFTIGENFGLDGDFFAIVASDFNGDGNLDMAISYVSFGIPNVSMFLGSGDGTFSSYVSELSPAYLNSSSLVAGDFNNDGIIDLVSIGAGSSDQYFNYGPVAVFLGDGDGTFTSPASQPNVTLSNPDTAMGASGDFDGDGILDLAVADEDSTVLTILKGNGDGTFTQVNGQPALPASSRLVGTADFNGDGKLDLAYSIPPNIVVVFLGNGDDTFQSGISTTVNDGQVRGGSIGDFNGDGRFDIAFANSSDTFFTLQQTIAPPRASVTLQSGQDPSDINQTVTFTATVTASPFNPTGSLTFKQGATILGVAPLANGQASLQITFAKAGAFPIIAIYSGDQNYRAKSSTAIEQVVDKFQTAIGLIATPNPAIHGQPITLTATVSSSGPTPTGKVVFKSGAEAIGSAVLVDGVATLVKPNLPVGSYSISAIYRGDDDCETSQITPQWQLVID